MDGFGSWLTGMLGSIATNRGNMAISAAIFVLSLLALLWLRRQTLDRLARWSAGTKWPMETVVCQPVRLPLLVLCVYLSAYLGLEISPVSGDWKSLVGRLLWSLFVVTVLLALLRLIDRLISLIEKRWNMTLRVMRTASSVIVTGVFSLVVTAIWGMPTTPILVFVATAGGFILLASRDAAPNFFANHRH